MNFETIALLNKYLKMPEEFPVHLSILSRSPRQSEIITHKGFEKEGYGVLLKNICSLLNDHVHAFRDEYSKPLLRLFACDGERHVGGYYAALIVEGNNLIN